MPARYLVVDVFAREPLAGNALAVFPDPGSVDPSRMQRVAREMNLSETTFVTGVDGDAYDVRIFTPTDEMPFAGHPTLGTAWTLRHLGAVTGERVTQRSLAGETPVTFEADGVWLERGGTVDEDVADIDGIVAALDIDHDDVGFDAAMIGGKPVALHPALSDAGFPVLIVPMTDAERVASLRIPTSLDVAEGVYCVAPVGPGRIKARFFAPSVGVMEDPATGAAAAALGLYFGARVGELEVQIEQGVEIGRPSFIGLRAAPGRARVGGVVHLALEGSLVV